MEKAWRYHPNTTLKTKIAMGIEAENETIQRGRDIERVIRPSPTTSTTVNESNHLRLRQEATETREYVALLASFARGGSDTLIFGATSRYAASLKASGGIERGGRNESLIAWGTS
jgi:hypothetical protein